MKYSTFTRYIIAKERRSLWKEPLSESYLLIFYSIFGKIERIFIVCVQATENAVFKDSITPFYNIKLKKKRCNVTLKSCSTWEFRIRYSCCRPIIYFWLTIVRIIFRHNNQCLETWILIKKYGNYPNLLFLFYFCNNF